MGVEGNYSNTKAEVLTIRVGGLEGRKVRDTRTLAYYIHGAIEAGPC